MAQHLVVLMVGVLVEAENTQQAVERAKLPFQHGLVPNMTQLETGGVRLANDKDREKMEKLKG